MGTAETASAVISARDLVVRRGERVVARVPRLELGPGETLVLLGPNGAGKTTLLLALALLLPSEGELRVDGEIVRDAIAMRRRMAVVLQRPLLLDREVLANVTLGLILRGVARATAETRAHEWLGRLGVGHLAGRQARGLSGGEAQRVSLARAFALEPAVLFLDEPFAGLDAPSREAILADTGRLLADTKTSALLVTHDRDEAASLGDRVAVIIDGEVRQIGAPETVFSAPVDPQVALFVGVETILPAHVVEVADEVTRLDVAGQTIEVTELPPHDDLFPLLLVSPTDVIVSRERLTGSARNHFDAEVVRVEPIGRVVRVVLDCGFPLVAHLTRASVRELGIGSGARVVASFKATSPHLLARRRPPSAAALPSLS
ncbi:MAG TPA: ABC transporter ATP-binding protein [Candidatus Limnocylindria bacterium]|nr:ABC transporter ATP-binding protein [Candidatus Limnocylindria bacterium]